MNNQLERNSYILLGDLRFHYRAWEGEGRPAVLLHGLASNARIWDLVAPRLAGPLRVFALDQRNHGLTDPADDGFDFADVTRDLAAFLDALNLERPLLIGHSWGAHTVLHYASSRPFGPAAPGGIVLVDGGYVEMSSAPGFTWEAAEQRLTPPDLDGMPRETFLERLRDWMDGFYSEEAAEIILANFGVDDDDRIFRRLPIPKHMRIARAIYEHRPVEHFSRLRCPALLCPAVQAEPHDEHTRFFQALQREGIARAEQSSPHVRTVWFHDTVHDSPLHRPAELAKTILDFARDEGLLSQHV